MRASSPALSTSSPITDPAAAPPFRLACPGDLDRLYDLERLCFDPERRDSRATLRRSLAHPHHEVWIPDHCRPRLEAALFLRALPHDLRIYSIATHPDFRGKGWGTRFIDLARNRALERRHRRIILEADAALPGLLSWYQRHGFERQRLLPSFYGPGRDAWRFYLSLSG